MDVKATAAFTYDPNGGCSGSCSSASSSPSFGSGNNELDSINFRLFLGQTPYGRDAGFLQLLADTPSPALATPNALSVPSPDSSVTVITNTSSGVIEQVLTAQGLINVAIIDSYNYALQCFYASEVGSQNGSGLYTTNGPAFATWFISNPDGNSANNRLWVTNQQNGANTVYQYTYTASSLRWDLLKPDGQVDSVWNVGVVGNVNLTNKFEQVSIGSQIVSLRQSTYQYVPSINSTLLTQVIEGTGSQTRTTTYTYYTTGNGANLAQQINYWDGNWVYYVYDAYGRKINEYSAYNNSPPPSGGPPNPTVNLCKETDYTYAMAPGAGQDNVGAYTPYTTTLSLPAKQSDGTYAMEQVSSSSDSIAISGSQRTDYLSRSDSLGNALSSQREISIATDYTQDRPLLVQNEDGTTITYAYPDQFTRYEYDPDGTQKTTILDNWGNPIAYTNLTTKTTPNVILARTLYTYTNSSGVVYDELRRSHDETDLAGRIISYRWYDCCGVSAVTNEDGAATVYSYDVLKRRTASTVYFGGSAGIETTNILDPLGRTTLSQRIGTDQSAIVLSQNQYDVLGNVISQTNALGGVTSLLNYVLNGQKVSVSTFPDGGNKTNLYYRDGRLQSTSGTGVHGMQYTYDVEQDPNNPAAWVEVTTETHLDANGNPTSEWTKTYMDGFGRPYMTSYAAAAAPYPSSISLFNGYGRLWKKTDPDGVVTLYSYYDNSGDINQSQVQYTIIAEDPNTQLISSYNNLETALTSLQSGIDRVKLQQRAVVPAGSGMPDLVQTSTYVWTNGETDGTGTLTSRSSLATSGLTNWTTRFKDSITSVTTQEKTTYYGSRTGHSVTSTAPDSSYTIAAYSYGRPGSFTSYDSTGSQLAQVSYTYDAHGHQYQTIDARNGATISTYNNADLLISSTTPNPGTPGSSAQTTLKYYNLMLQATNTVNPDGTRSTNAYVLTGELGQTSGSRTFPVAYTYDYAGRMKTMQTWQAYPASGSALTTWNYDAYRGYLNSKIYNDGKGTTFGYTAAARLKTRTWARAVTTTYGYENAGSISTITYSDSTPGVTYGYDRLGRRTTIGDNGITTTLSYDLADDETAEAYVGGSLDGLSVTNGYDSFVRRMALAALNGGNSILNQAFSYDQASRLQSVSDSASSLSANYTYILNSPLIGKITLKNGNTVVQTTTNAYDYINRLQSTASAATGAGTPAASYAYSYNNANQRIITRLADGTYWRYEYDVLGQVISGHKFFADETPVPGQQFDYTFDTIGNRTKAERGGDQAGANQRLANYSPNLLNQYTTRDVPGYLDVVGVGLSTTPVVVNSSSAWRKNEYFRQELSVANSTTPIWERITVSANGQAPVNGNQFVPKTPEVFSYDYDGNLTSDGRWNYTWDAENRLVQMVANTSVGPQQLIKFEYDANGRRIRKQVWPNTGGTGTPSVDLKFLYDGWNVIAELNSLNSASPIRTYMWGFDLSGSVQGAGGVGGLTEVTYLGSATTNCFTAFDGNGNLSALINSADGTTIAQYEYGPFGEVIRATGPMAKVNPFRFSTKYQDDETDIVMYPHRPYNPSTGRFLSQDPLAEQSFLRAQMRRDRKHLRELWQESLKPTYVFVSNDPADYIDPLGLNVYKIKLPSGVSGSIVDHRQIIGDDGNGGCYVLEFYAQTCKIGCFGAKLVGKGEVDVRHYKQSASDYIKENSLNITDTVETDNVYFYPVQNGSVDSNLSRDADGLEKTGAGTYVLLWNDCGTIANSWLKHAKEVLKQAEDSVPGGGPFDGPGF